jgi:hypothetical protein
MATTYKTVFDLMANAAKGRIFRGENVADMTHDELDYYDGQLAEFKNLGLVERNILAGINMPDQFTMANWDKEFRINCTTVSKADGPGVGHLTHDKEITLHPYESEKWLLASEEGIVRYSDHRGKRVDQDRGVLGLIKSMCPNMNDDEADGLPMALIGEKLTQGQDMRHMFMKMYLMLMDLNMSVVTRQTNRRMKIGGNRVVYPKISNAVKMQLIASKQIVVDAEGFTPEELRLLEIAGQRYPHISYGRPNIYNSCHMERDDIAIVSSNDIDISGKNVFSPNEMYRLIVTIATKLDATDDMEEAFKMMRGRMMHMQDVLRLVEKRKVYSGVPRSTSFTRALGGSTRFRKVVKTVPGYIASSVSLIADILLGKVFELTATMFIERIGGLGDLVCETPTATASRIYNGLLRDWGLSSMQKFCNSLMLEWENVGAAPYHWSVQGTWKPYILALTDEMRKGIDVPIPQLTFELAISTFEETCWGAMRSWRGYNGAGVSDLTDLGESGKKKKDERLRLTAAFTWAMGVRATRPKVFKNAFKKKEVSLTSKELRFLRGTMGFAHLSHVAYTLVDEYMGREDWTEKSATGLIKDAIDGTKCSVILSGREGRWQPITVKIEDLTADITQSLGFVEKDKETVVDDEILAMAFERNRKKKTKEEEERVQEVFQKMRQVISSPKVKLGSEKLGKPKKYEKVDVPGDGKCGIHAVVQNMSNRQLLRPGEEQKVFENFDGKMNSQTWHDVQSLAASLLDYGIGLRVYDESGGEKLRVIDYGDVGKGGVSIARRDGHFYSAVEKDDPLEDGSYNYEGGSLNNEEQLEALNEMRKFFEPGGQDKWTRW